MPDGESREQVMDQVGPALSRLRRRTRSPGGRGDLSRNVVLTLVADADQPPTVGAVAAEMGVTQPVASRLVATCIAEGLLRRDASQDDGRVSLLRLTPEGEAARREVAREQRAVFDQITAAWSEKDRLRFARYLVRYGEDADAWSAAHRLTN